MEKVILTEEGISKTVDGMYALAVEIYARDHARNEDEVHLISWLLNPGRECSKIAAVRRLIGLDILYKTGHVSMSEISRDMELYLGRKVRLTSIPLAQTMSEIKSKSLTPLQKRLKDLLGE